MASDAAVDQKPADAVPEEKQEEVVDENTTATTEEAPKKEQEDKDAEQDSHPKQRRDRNDRPTYSNKKKNMSDYTSLAESNDETEIRSQVEFYFSDSNLPTDQYLLDLTGGHENKPVPLKTIHNFKRMRHFQPYSAVRSAVAASTFLSLDDKDEITRKTPLDAKFGQSVEENRNIATDATIVQSIYAKGFGREYSTLQLDVENFFKPYGPVKSVRMRRHDNGFFKGSVFIEFESEELAKNFLELDPKPKWYSGAKEGKDGEEDNEEAEGIELKISSKKDYVNEKNEGIRNGEVKPYPSKNNNNNNRDRDNRGKNGRGGRGGRGRGRGGRGRGGRRDRDDREDRPDDDDWKARRDRDQGRGRRDNDSGKKRAREDGGGDDDDAEAKKAKTSEE